MAIDKLENVLSVEVLDEHFRPPPRDLRLSQTWRAEVRQFEASLKRYSPGWTVRSVAGRSIVRGECRSDPQYYAWHRWMAIDAEKINLLLIADAAALARAPGHGYNNYTVTIPETALMERDGLRIRPR